MVQSTPSSSWQHYWKDTYYTILYGMDTVLYIKVNAKLLSLNSTYLTWDSKNVVVEWED